MPQLTASDITRLIDAAANGELEAVQSRLQMPMVLKELLRISGSQIYLAAASRGHLGVLQYLAGFQKPISSTTDSTMRQPFTDHQRIINSAAANGHSNVVSFLIESMPTTHEGLAVALVEAAKAGQLQVVKTLLQSLQKHLGSSTLPEECHDVLVAALENGRRSIVEYFITELPDFVTPQLLASVLFRVVKRGPPDFVRWLGSAVDLRTLINGEKSSTLLKISFIQAPFLTTIYLLTQVDDAARACADLQVVKNLLKLRAHEADANRLLAVLPKLVQLKTNFAKLEELLENEAIFTALVAGCFQTEDEFHSALECSAKSTVSRRL